MRFSFLGALPFRLAPWCLLAASAYANPNDTLQLSASYSVTHNDNLFLLPKGANAQALVGRDSAAETIKAATATAAFVKDYGLQHVELTVNAINYDYQNFSYLSFSALNYAGLLKWNVTPRIRGTVTATRDKSLVGFNDFQNYSIRNERIVTNTRADGIYELDGAWQLVGGASRFSVANTSTVQEQRAFDLDSVEGGIQRVFASGSQLSYRLRRGSGSYSAVSFAAGAFLPSAFDETENQLQMVWLVTDKSQIIGRLAYRKRTFNDFSFRDYSGVSGGATLTWGLSARTNLEAGISHELSDYQALYANQMTTEKLIFGPVWQVKEKLKLRLRQEVSRRRFSGDVPGVNVVQQREDHVYLSRASVEWQPREQVDLSAWLQQDRRDSNYTGFTYTSRSVGVLAQISF
ncbi:outer membrane beta-barrel protein [Xylophilus rhododendri]|uniref:Outer membrane beta-barrel protein n=1 Tax=Xylophilus rhododendri TaxID=2697032 RepID=A0A857JB94_9BURK|nr:XrtB/PEP-CTERM-associated polysaccharide biosynthesis outer membrane protein EpsL [Xylophilus rhododendri]QHI99985.1 outer membrane beta-barrel protein [Xylophilus rhododendri]